MAVTLFQIAEVEPIAVELPLAHSIGMSGETISAARNLLVRIADSEGRTGWGEAASAPLMTGESLSDMLAAVQSVSGRLSGRSIHSINSVGKVISDTVPTSPGARAALEMAVLDLAGQHVGRPLHDLLGGRIRESAPALAMLATGSVDAEEAQALRLLERGYRAFKIKVGADDVGHDLARCRAVRRAVGTGCRVSADANGGYTESEAIAFATEAASIGLDFLEQPVPACNLDAMRACAQASTVPIAVDEGFMSAADIRRHHRLGAASGGSLKPLKFGIQNLMSCGQLMNRRGMSVNLAGKIAESGIASAAIAHLAVALPQLDWDASMTNQYLAIDVVLHPPMVTNGRIAPRDSPGLGIVVDQDRLTSVRLS